MEEELAVLECDPTALAGAIGTAALDAEGNDPHEEMFVRIDSGGITTPASAVDARQSSFCTLHPALFEDMTVFEPTTALFPVETVLDWLSYFGDAQSLTVSFVGESGAEHATAVRFVGERREVRIACVDAPSLLEEVEIWLPDRFEGTQFLTDDGNPVPTTVETTAPELDAFIDAVTRCQSEPTYPLVVSDDEIRFEVAGEAATVTGSLAGTVEGPGFSRRFGPDFARIARAVDGQVTLQTGTEQPFAVVSTEPGVTYRYVLADTRRP